MTDHQSVWNKEFLSWLSSNEPDSCSWGCRFNPWPHSVGYRSSVAVSCGVGHRSGSDLALLWLWCRSVATAPIQPLAWEPPYAEGVALKKKKEKLFSYVSRRFKVHLSLLRNRSFYYHPRTLTVPSDALCLKGLSLGHPHYSISSLLMPSFSV